MIRYSQKRSQQGLLLSILRSPPSLEVQTEAMWLQKAIPQVAAAIAIPRCFMALRRNFRTTVTFQCLSSILPPQIPPPPQAREINIVRHNGLSKTSQDHTKESTRIPLSNGTVSYCGFSLIEDTIEIVEQE